MKTMYLFLFFISFFYSCNNDSDLKLTTKSTSLLAKDSGNEGVPDVRANANNPYDYAGRLHNELADSYFASGNLPVTLAGIITRVETLANSNAAFFAIEGNLYQPLSAVRLQYILDNPYVSRTDVIANSALSVKAKSSISTFIDQVLPLCSSNAGYNVIYDFVVAYESTLLSDPMLTSYDKKVLLTTTSIVRYSAHKRKRPKKNTDLDWELNVTHLVGSLDGSATGTSEAIVEALSLGIVNHQ